MISADFATGTPTGYHYTTNKGFSAANPPTRIDLELSQILKQFIELWAKQLVEAGAPHWAMSEGTNVVPNVMPDEPTMES